MAGRNGRTKVYDLVDLLVSPQPHPYTPHSGNADRNLIDKYSLVGSVAIPDHLFHIGGEAHLILELHQRRLLGQHHWSADTIDHRSDRSRQNGIRSFKTTDRTVFEKKAREG
jgi:hypothetical protein